MASVSCGNFFSSVYPTAASLLVPLLSASYPAFDVRWSVWFFRGGPNLAFLAKSGKILVCILYSPTFVFHTVPKLYLVIRSQPRLKQHGHMSAINTDLIFDKKEFWN